MKLFRTVKSIQSYSLKLKMQNKKIGFVPTMGYLHEGHLSLVRAARKENDVVVVSIFVNPTQFAPHEDYKRYPRDLKSDLTFLIREKVDAVFCPSVRAIYPEGYSTEVIVKGLSDVLCGKSRPGHFRGVTTVCTKLFNIVQPDVAYFGQKDAQQAMIIKRMTKDLNLPLKIKVLPIVREKDGLAMSSRNVYLREKERMQARVLYQALQEAKKMVKAKEKSASRIKRKIKNMISKMTEAKIDYVEIVDLKELKPVDKLDQPVLLALAVWFGKARLIDNIILKP